MTRNFMKLAPAIASALCFAGSAAAQDITPSEKDKALQYLGETRNGLVDAVKGLSEAQWKFKPASDRWSVAEVVEHLAVLENLFVNNLCAQLTNAPSGKPDTDVKKIDAIILAKVQDRSTKVQAPENIAPTGRWTPQESLDRFLADRRETANFLTSSANLRGHVLSHPVLGAMDAYEWVLAVAAHTDRHTKQILEVKSDPHFPTN
jgi:uncharacterized damage-inducible protein DinB